MLVETFCSLKGYAFRSSHFVLNDFKCSISLSILELYYPDLLFPSVVLIANLLVLTEVCKVDYPFYRMIGSPLTEAMLTPLDPRCEHVQFSGPLSDNDYIKLAHFMRDYPKVSLRTFFGLNPMEDLEFLRFFPDLEHFQCELINLKTLSGLRHLPEGL